MIWLNVLLIIVALVLTAVILLQNRSAGLGSAFGGASEGFTTRRGSEKRLWQLTIALSVVFLALSAAHLFIG